MNEGEIKAAFFLLLSIIEDVVYDLAPKNTYLESQVRTIRDAIGRMGNNP